MRNGSAPSGVPSRYRHIRAQVRFYQALSICGLGLAAGLLASMALGAEKGPYAPQVEQLKYTNQRLAAKNALIAAGAKAVPDVLAGMSETRQEWRLLAILGLMGRSIVPRLLDFVSDPQYGQYAAEGLFQLVDSRDYKLAPDFLVCMKNSRTKQYCGMALVKVISPDASGQFSRLQKALHDADPDVRAYAALALGQLGSAAKAAVPDLALLVKDRQVSVRLNAVKALASIAPQDPVARQALQEAAAKDKDPEVVKAAKAVLEKSNR